MLDVTIGPVVNVIDGNTFTINVTHIGNHNKFIYRGYETVRLANTSARSLSTVAGLTERQKLINMLMGKRVRCMIHHRNQYNVLIADVEIY